VVGTKTGEIRLFGASTLRAQRSDSYLDYTPRAKNTLPGLGTAIVAMDVTSDGHWILATCKKYLIIIPTKSPTGNFTGFDQTLKASDRDPPRKLELKAADHKLVGEINFTPAKFNYSGEETSICTSTGCWLISWNFTQVRRGVLDSYSMKQYSQTVVADDFSFETDSNIVVTMPDDVKLARTKK